MRKFTICFCMMSLLAGHSAFAVSMRPTTAASRAPTSTASAVATTATNGDLQSQINDLQLRLIVVEKELADLKKGTNSSTSAVTAVASSGATTVAAVEEVEVETGITGTSRPMVLADIAQARKNCASITNKTTCKTTYSSVLYGVEPPALNGDMYISNASHASIQDACRMGCAENRIDNWSGALKIGTIGQVGSCSVLPFYDVDNKNRLNCATFNMIDRSSVVGSLCAWDDSANKCTTARMLCTQDGYCSTDK